MAHETTVSKIVRTITPIDIANTTEYQVGEIVEYNGKVGIVVIREGCDRCILQDSEGCHVFECYRASRGDKATTQLVEYTEAITKDKPSHCSNTTETGIKHDSEKLDWSLLPYKELVDIFSVHVPSVDNVWEDALIRLVKGVWLGNYDYVVYAAVRVMTAFDCKVTTIEQVVKVLNFGAKKYTPYNWQKLRRSRIESAAFRHLAAIASGEELDSETKLPHAVHLLCNLLFIMWHFNNPTMGSSVASQPENNLAVEKSDVVDESKNENLSSIVSLGMTEKLEYALGQFVEYNDKVGRVTKAAGCIGCLLQETPGCEKFICTARSDGFSVQLIEV